MARDATNRSALRRSRRAAPKSTPAGRPARSESSRDDRARGRPNSAGSSKPSCAQRERTQDGERERERCATRRVGALYFPPVSSGIPAGIAHCRHGRSFIRSYTYIVYTYGTYIRRKVRCACEHEYIDADKQVCTYIWEWVRAYEYARATDRDATEIFCSPRQRSLLPYQGQSRGYEIRLDGSVNKERAARIKREGRLCRGEKDREREKHDRERT